MKPENVITSKAATIYLDEYNATHFENSAEGREIMISQLTAMGMTDEIERILSAWGDVPVITKSVEELKAEKRAEIAAARYDYEIAGVIINGIHITTDREDQAMITAVALSAVVDPTYTTVWKGADGYLTLNASEVIAMARIVGAHIEAAFAEEKRLAALIDAAQNEAELAPISWTLT